MSVSPQFDFDLFMVELAGKLKSFEYKVFAKTYHELPSSTETLCLPNNKVLIPLLAAKSMCLAAEPHSGASALALLVAYLRISLAAAPIQLKLFEGLTAVKAALGNQLLGTDEERSSAIVIADRLRVASENSPATFFELCRLVGENNFALVIVVVELEVVVKARHGDDAEKLRSFEVIQDVRDGQPYSPLDLKSLAFRLGRSDGFVHAIDTGLIKTVAQVLESRIDSLPGDDRPGAIAELAVNDNLRRLALRARLLEISARDNTIVELERNIGLPISIVNPSLLACYISIFSFENNSWFQVAPDKRGILDQLLLSNAQSLRDELNGTDVSLLFEFEQWVLFRGFAQGEKFDASSAILPEYFRRLTCTLIEGSSSVGNLLALLEHVSMDPWGATNVAYALVANWESFPKLPRRDALNALLARRDLRGCYAVAEAALFFGAATPKRVWSALQDACWKLLEDAPQSKELTLVVDGFMWRPPIDDRENWLEFIKDYFEAIDRHSLQGGALRVFAAYHPAGVSALYPEWDAMSQKLADTEAQAEHAAWLIEWHFIHRTISQAIGFRFGRNDKDLLCRELHQLRTVPVDYAQRSLLKGLLNYPSAAGWGFHAAAYFAGKSGWLTDTKEGQDFFLELLFASDVKDVGVATGVAGYEAARRIPCVREAVFRERSRVKALEDAVEDGVSLEGLTFSQEQFQFVHNVEGLWKMLDMKMPNVEREGLQRHDVLVQFIRDVETRAGETTPDMRHLAAKVVEGIRKGSRMRSLEQAIPARERQGPLGPHVFEVLLQMASEDVHASKPALVQLSLL